MDSLQKRSKWHSATENLKQGDVVLLKDAGAHRNDWPMGLVSQTFPSSDGLVRSAEVRIVKDQSSTVLVRPVTELILLT